MTQESSGKQNHSEQDSGADSEATSKETVSDLEGNQEDIGSAGAKPDPGPSPDGALDEPEETDDLI